jgi:hypothetical protein
MKVNLTTKTYSEVAEGVYDDAWTVTITFTEGEVFALLAAYQPSSSTSPSAGDSRVIARTVAEALRQKALGVV